MRRLIHIKTYALFLISSNLWLIQGQGGVATLILISSTLSLAHRIYRYQEAIFGYFGSGLRQITWFLICVISIPVMSHTAFYAFLALTTMTLQAQILGRADPEAKRDWITCAMVCEFSAQTIGAIALM